MMRIKRWLVGTLTACFLLTGAAHASNVTYSGDAGQFVFAPGGEHSVTDLFTDFKDVMPGDTITQTITLRNNASDKVDVKVYMRALGAHEDSKEFLSQLSLTVATGEGKLFDAPADQTAQLTDWVELGTLYSGGTVELNVTLSVPVTLDNRFMNQVGLLDWQFMVEEYPVDEEDPDKPVDPDDPDKPVDPDDPDKPVDPDDPDKPVDPDDPDKPVDPDDPDKPADPEDPDKPVDPEDPDKPDVPKTGDAVNVGLFAALLVGSGAAVVWLIVLLRRSRREEEA